MEFLSNILVKAGLVVEGTTALQGTSTAPTPSTGDSSTKIATTAFVKNQNYLTGDSSFSWSNITGTPTSLAGYGITDAYTKTETNNIFSGSTAITGYNKTNWDTAFGWGNHALAGYLTTISGIAAGGELSGTYPNPTLVNSAVTGKILSGLNLSGGGTISATDSILTAFGKIQNQISGLVGGVIYQGTWNADTNTPTLTSSVGTAGHYYIVSVAGSTNLNGITSWAVGDWAIFNGTQWDRVDNTDAVSSVNGFTGAVSLTTSNISEGSNLYFTNPRAIGATLTGFSAAAGTVTSSDTIISGLQKVVGNSNSLGSVNGIVKSNGSGVFSAAVSGTDYQAPINISGNAQYKVLTGGTSTSLTAESRLNFFDNIGALYISSNVSFGYGAGIEFDNTAVNGTQWGFYGGTSSDTGFMLYRYQPTQVELGYWNTDRYALRNDVKMAWSSTTNSFGTPDIALVREGAGVLQVNNGTTGTYASMKMLGATLTGLAGSGTRMVVADSSGVLSTQAIPNIPVTSVFGRTGAVTATSGDYNTSQVTENTNLYYTDARARAAISESVTGLDYNSITGVLSLTSGYLIPTTSFQTNWDAAYNDKINSAAVTGTTTKTLTLTQQDGGTVTASWSDLNAVTTVFGRSGDVVATSGDYNTSQVTENTNLYYTNTRARAALSFSAGSGAYNSTTGVITIPTDNNQIGNSAGYLNSSTGIASGAAAGGELSGTYPNPTVLNSAVIGKVLTGLNLSGGGTISATDSILQAFGKVQNQISAMVGGVMYQGTWNASTNSPALTSSVGTKGHYYIVATAGSTNLNGITSWNIGDWVIFNGSTWDKVDNTDAVSSVNGFTGAVSLTTANISEVTNLYYTDARARGALSFTAGSGAYNSTTGVITIPTNTNQLTNGADYITATTASTTYVSLTGSYPNPTWLTELAWAKITGAPAFITGNQTITLSGDVTGSGATSISTTLATVNSNVGSFGNSTTVPTFTVNAKGLITAASSTSIPTAATASTGLLTSTDWNIFNGKQAALSGTGFVKISGTTITYDNSTYALASALSGYLPLSAGSGQALTGDLYGTNLLFSGYGSFGTVSSTATNLVAITSSYAAANTERGSIAWGDGSGIVGKIYSTYNGSNSTKLHFGGLYNGAYNGTDVMMMDGLTKATTLYGALNGTSADFSGNVSLSTGAQLSLSAASPNFTRLYRSGGLVLENNTYQITLSDAGVTTLPSSLSGTSAVMTGTIKVGATASLNINLGTNFLDFLNNGVYARGTVYSSGFDFHNGGAVVAAVSNTGVISGTSAAFSGDITTGYVGEKFIGNFFSSSYRSGLLLNGSDRSVGLTSITGDATGYVWFGTNNGTERGRFSVGGNLLLKTTTDNGTDALQVNGSISGTSAAFSGAGSFGGTLGVTTDGGNEQFRITRASNTNQQLILGYHSSGYSQIQSVLQGVSGTPLVLNPIGGNLLLKTTTDNGTDALQVAGSISNGRMRMSSNSLLDAISGNNIGIAFGSSGILSTDGSANLTPKDLGTSTNKWGTVFASLGKFGNAGSNATLEVTASSGEVFRADAASGAPRIVADQTRVVLGSASANVLIKTFTDNGTDALQVAGSASFSGGIGAANGTFGASGLIAGGGSSYAFLTPIITASQNLNGTISNVVNNQANNAAAHAKYIVAAFGNSWHFGMGSSTSTYGNDFTITVDASTTTAPFFRLATTGAATFSSSVTASSFFESSDSRLKTLISDNYNVSGIDMITPKLYQKNGKTELGYYAQDLVGVLDSAVTEGQDGMLSLSYREVLVAKVYALEQEVKMLKDKYGV
jgi:hypothetical protein